uniref:Oligoribonuclease n=1 Tax=Anthurium amnicola TaxID=1678845 RepID=A0A1D1Z113_9ARAE
MAANLITNAFSVLSLDVEDDREETGTAPAAAASSKHENQVAKSDKKKDKLLENGSLPENDKPSSGILSSPSGEYKMPLVWIDLEMTGLDVAIDRILEIACVITSGNLTKSVEGPDLVIHQTKECLDNMGEWCREHHAASGLTKRVLQSTITEQDAEKQVIDFVRKHVGSYTPLLAGNSVYVDLSFLKKYMPDLASLFPHVLVDVSSIKALCVRWFPRENKKAPSKENKHRAMDDIKESIRELKYYKENIFKKPKI